MNPYRREKLLFKIAHLTYTIDFCLCLLLTAANAFNRLPPELSGRAYVIACLSAIVCIILGNSMDRLKRRIRMLENGGKML